MTEQEKAISLLKRLKATGISYKGFCETTGLNTGSLYNYTSKPNTMTEQTAAYIVYSIKENYPKQWAFLTMEE